MLKRQIYAFLIVREAQLRKREVWDKSLNKAHDQLGSSIKIQNISDSTNISLKSG